MDCPAITCRLAVPSDEFLAAKPNNASKRIWSFAPSFAFDEFPAFIKHWLCFVFANFGFDRCDEFSQFFFICIRELRIPLHFICGNGFKRSEERREGKR